MYLHEMRTFAGSLRTWNRRVDAYQFKFSQGWQESNVNKLIDYSTYCKGNPSDGGRQPSDHYQNMTTATVSVKLIIKLITPFIDRQMAHIRYHWADGGEMLKNTLHISLHLFFWSESRAVGFQDHVLQRNAGHQSLLLTKTQHNSLLHLHVLYYRETVLVVHYKCCLILM